MKRFAFYPLCIGLFALLSVFASNTEEASARELLVPAALVLTGTLAVLAVAGLAMRSVHRGALFAAAFVFCFLTYGFWVDVLWAMHPEPALRVAYHRAILVVQGLALIGIGYFVVRAKDPQSLTPRLNRFSLILLACPVVIVLGRWISAGLRAAPSATATADQSLLIAPLSKSAERPDIYFIVLDAHGRQDVLRDQYHYDDGPFLQHLRDKGFWIGDQTTSNYMWTELSVPATLNMRYLNDLPGEDVAARIRVAAQLHRNSALVAELRTLGYRTVAFEALEKWLCLDNSDIYYSVSNQIGFTPLQQLLLDTSALSQFGGERIRSRLVLDQFHLKREMMLFKFATMPQVAALKGPKFVFLHVMEPHTPFVFAADGSDPGKRGYGSMFDGLNDDITVAQYHDWYREQAIYTDNQAAIMIDRVLARSAKPPVIVLIGDHGPRSGMTTDPTASDLHEYMGNLTAVYLPGKDNRGLYPQITPVNLFRVVLNDYFDAGLPMLPDKSYYSYPQQFPLRDVTAVVKPGAQTQPVATANMSEPTR
ncbi:MAG TPA: sulfatase-like hydrolase/transferase [Tepidisphaeraceae bacterium]|nr:sulfatase-like hydrolase/transferase [Tepidisphaeraceae bacterium]